MGDRDGPVLLRVHLREAARLILRRHEEEVAPRHHPVLDRRVEAHVAADAARVGRLRAAQLPLVPRVAPAHQDHLGSAAHAATLVVHEPVDDAGDELHALLGAEAAAEADEGGVRIPRQPQLLLQRRLAPALSLHEVRGTVPPRDVRISQGAPLVRDAVQDSRQAEADGLLTQDGVQTEASLRSLDLLRIARGDGEDPVRKLDPSGDQVDAVPAEVCVVALELVLRLQREPEEPVDRVRALPEPALVPQVVEHHDAARLPVGPVPLVLVEEVDGQQPRLPVVRYEADLLAVRRAAELQDQGRLGRRDGQQSEAEQVVLVLAAPHGIAVDARAAEAVVVDEDVIAALSGAKLLALVEVPHLVLLAVEPDVGAAHVLALPEFTVAWRHDERPMAPDGEFEGIGAGDHGEATGLGPGVQLRGYDDDGSAQVPRPVSRWPLFHQQAIDIGGLLEGRHARRLQEPRRAVRTAPEDHRGVAGPLGLRRGLGSQVRILRGGHRLSAGVPCTALQACQGAPRGCGPQ
mmetsp:Transcript_104555/g.312263  ORF Transcript_104555/g.312263 Transcript_104555/m.312263 type:complete len:519 (+) Transcript_104555:320-1876(+)